MKKVVIHEEDFLNLPSVKGEEFYLTVDRFIKNKLIENGFNLQEEYYFHGTFDGKSIYLQEERFHESN